VANSSAPRRHFFGRGHRQHGIVGASKGMDDMVKEAEASIASTVAHAKGWTPAGAK